MALTELYRIIRKRKKIFVVVRSTDDPDATMPGVSFDTITGLTTYTFRDEFGKIYPERKIARYFHTKQSISDYLTKTGFHVVGEKI